MDAFAAFCFGVWFGITGPLAIHVLLAFLTSHARHPNSSREAVVFIRVLRFLFAPLLILGMLGVASVFGATKTQANPMAGGMLLGAAAYGLGLYLYRRYARQSQPAPLSDRDIWLSQWELIRAAGRRSFLMQNALSGIGLGVIASVLVALSGARIGEASLGAFPWVLVIFAFFPIAALLYARRNWEISERQFRAARGPGGT